MRAKLSRAHSLTKPRYGAKITSKYVTKFDCSTLSRTRIKYKFSEIAELDFWHTASMGYKAQCYIPEILLGSNEGQEMRARKTAIRALVCVEIDVALRLK
jgi:hypothetical protein